jgi:putative ATP-dependent endonuclease of OLD family
VLRKVLIKNYRAFDDFTLDFSLGVNIVVGDNDAGKSTLLEAINLALTSRLGSNPISAELSPYLFSQSTTQRYVERLRAGDKPSPPEILIELYFADDDDHASLRGTNNMLGEDCPGARLKIRLDDDLTDAYQAYVAEPEKVTLVPTEYYMWEWLAFSATPSATPETYRTLRSSTQHLSGSRTAPIAICSRSLGST